MSKTAAASAPAHVDPDHPPAGSKVSRVELGPGVVAWEVPPTGKSGGLLIFATMWLLLIGLFTAVAAVPAFGEVGSSKWLLFLFLVPFWVVGIGMLYGGLRAKYAQHFIAVDADTVKMSRVLSAARTGKASLGARSSQ